MKSRYLLGAGAALAVALGCAEANAQFAFLGGRYRVAYYIGPEEGWTSLQNQNENVTNFGANLNIGGNRVQYNSGFNAGARAGIQWGPIRVEEEYSYRHNGLSKFAGFTAGSTSNLFTGNRNSNAIMTNFIYDFTLGWPVSPHIGFGVGTLFKSSSTWQFGYQGIAGFRYDINPLLAFDLDYRYLATTDTTYTNKGVFPLPPFGFGGLKVRTGYSTNNIVASLTMKFGAPPAPPPPAPPAPPPPPVHQVYLVFFDWDKYNITPEGMQIIQLAANQYRQGGSVRLQVTGYTDLSGSAGYNQRLSERRANAVAAALEKLGVARSDMLVSGRGMNDPRVPTAPGVREPQNRRVEIVFP